MNIITVARFRASIVMVIESENQKKREEEREREREKGKKGRRWNASEEQYARTSARLLSGEFWYRLIRCFDDNANASWTEQGAGGGGNLRFPFNPSKTRFRVCFFNDREREAVSVCSIFSCKFFYNFVSAQTDRSVESDDWDSSEKTVALPVLSPRK